MYAISSGHGSDDEKDSNSNMSSVSRELHKHDTAITHENVDSNENAGKSDAHNNYSDINEEIKKS